MKSLIHPATSSNVIIIKNCLYWKATFLAILFTRTGAKENWRWRDNRCTKTVTGKRQLFRNMKRPIECLSSRVPKSSLWYSHRILLLSKICNRTIICYFSHTSECLNQKGLFWKNSALLCTKYFAVSEDQLMSYYGAIRDLHAFESLRLISTRHQTCPRLGLLRCFCW